VFANLSTADLRRLEILLPPLDEQRRIVDLIGSVNATIDAADRTRDATRALRTALLEDLLSEERGREEGWRETTLGEVTTVVGGGTPRTNVSGYWGGSIPWLTPTEVVAQDGRVISRSARTITEDGLAHSGARLLPAGSVLFTSRATIGAVGICGVSLATNQGFQSFVPGPDIDARFLMFWLQFNKQSFIERAGGSTFKEISRSAVRATPILLPPLDEQRRIVEVVSSVDERLEAEEAELVALRHLRASLLEDLLSGDHEIPEDYDRLLEKATRPGSSSTPEDTADVP
jgi:type I restriction enzyme S subunit